MYYIVLILQLRIGTDSTIRSRASGQKAPNLFLIKRAKVTRAQSIYLLLRRGEILSNDPNHALLLQQYVLCILSYIIDTPSYHSEYDCIYNGLA